MRESLDKYRRVLDITEILMILTFLALLLSQKPVMGIPVSQLAGIGALTVTLFAPIRRRLANQKDREDRREKTKDESPLHEGSDSHTAIYNVYGENAYIDAKPERREQSDHALNDVSVGERAAHNRSLDEFNSEAEEPERREQSDHALDDISVEERAAQNRSLDEFNSEVQVFNDEEEGETAHQDTLQSVPKEELDGSQEREPELEHE